ncbi:hypothetical protein ACHAXA_007890 [Cyclostephanos tholiformis]|uniref:Uncharacterized protein n=1 Tax=Cyclostephanos tholiformis TaxID=382380 RepID=A0ABD3SHC3_9STRA
MKNFNGRKYNIAPEFANSPYLSKPIGSFDHEKKPRLKPMKSTKGKQGDSDAESLTSLRSHRSAKSQRTQQSHGSSHTYAGKHMKNFLLLPREMSRILREFRQRNSSHPILRTPTAGQSDHEDDNSTIASEFAEGLDDKAVYSHCRKEQTLQDALFSGPLFAELAFLHATATTKSSVPTGRTLMLPPVDRIDHEGGDISDLDSPEGKKR